MKNPAMYLARSVRKLIRENFLQKRIDWTQAEGIAMDIVLPHSSIKNQGRTTHCWAYSMCSMIESELLASDTVCHLNPLYFAAHKRYPNRRGGLAQTFLDTYKRITEENGITEEWIKPLPAGKMPNAENYMVLTSFAHSPYYRNTVLNVPDNYERFPSYNIPLDKMAEAVKHSLKNGHTCVWEGDIHGTGYSHKRGVALTFMPSFRYNAFMRSLAYFFKFLKDDHMMHIVGMGHNAKGQCFFLIKNSIGETGLHKGYIYMSEDYFRTNTLSLTVRTDICRSLFRI